jgi:hypothetical protein
MVSTSFRLHGQRVLDTLSIYAHVKLVRLYASHSSDRSLEVALERITGDSAEDVDKPIIS